MADDSEQVEEGWAPFFFVCKDGSVKRTPFPLAPPSPEPADPDGVASKDITLDAGLGLWARIFLPPLLSKEKPPIVLYFHGGGFLIGRPDVAMFHEYCAQMARRSGAVWFCASYRLAPEHRLPAAIDDGFAAFRWLHSQALLQAGGELDGLDPWLAEADFSKVFVGGESAGGVMAHHVAMQALSKPGSLASWEPICIRGLVLVHPAFLRGAARTQEELDLHGNEILDWAKIDTMIKFSLPVGSSKESPIYNPLPAIASSDSVHLLPKMLVMLADLDMFHVFCLEYVKALEAAGCHVDVFMSHGVGHGFFIFAPDSEQAEAMKQRIITFIAEEAMAN